MYRKPQFLYGNSLVEYVLPVAIVLGVSIPAWQVLSGGLGSGLKNIFQPTANPSAVALSPAQAVNTPAVPSALPVASSNAIAAGTPAAPPVAAGAYGSVTITLKNGTKLSLNQYPSNATQLVETSGISGTTQYMAGMLQTLAQQLVAAGSITESQYNSLIALSNKGHDIGKVQGQLETLMASNGGTLVGLLDKPMPILGQVSYAPGWFEYTVGSNIQALGSGQTNPWGDGGQTIDGLTGYNVNDPNAWANPMFANFVTAYKAAASDGSLSDPVIKQIVDDLSFKILIGGEMMEENGSSNLVDSVKSIYTHYNSKGICAQGNGVDTGIQCS